MRLLLFWIEQGETRKWGTGPSPPEVLMASPRIPVQKRANDPFNRNALFPGNSENLLKQSSSTMFYSHNFNERALAASTAFGVPDIRFSVAPYDVGGVPTRLPQLLPHVESINVELKRLFVWYSGSPEELPPGDQGESLEMSAARFYKFIRECRLLRGSITRGIVDVIFKTVTVAMNRKGNGDQAVSKGTNTVGVHHSTRKLNKLMQPEIHSKTWKNNSFNVRSTSNSMMNRKMSFKDFYVALADVATRKYARRPTATGASVGPALHKLLLKDVLPMFARFWEKTSHSSKGGTAVSIYSSNAQQKLLQISTAVGGTPAKKERSWRQRWVQVHRLEDELRRTDVVRAFHLNAKQLIGLLKAPKVTPPVEIGNGLLSDKKRPVPNRFFRSTQASELLGVNNSSPTNKVSSSQMNGTSQDENIVSKVSSKNLEIKLSSDEGSANDLKDILHSVQSKIYSLQQTIGVSGNLTDLEPTTDVIVAKTVETTPHTAETHDSPEKKETQPSEISEDVKENGASPMHLEDLMTSERASKKKKVKVIDSKPEPRDKKGKSAKMTPVRTGEKCLQYKSDTASFSSKRRDPYLNPRQSQRNSASSVYFLISSTSNVYARLLLLKDTDGNRQKVSFRSLPLKHEVENEFVGVLNVHIMGLRKPHADVLGSLRIYLTSDDDPKFHFRHCTNKGLHGSSQKQLGLGVKFENYPGVLQSIFKECTLNRDMKVTFSAKRDGRARLSISRSLYNGAKTVSILKLNFTKTPKSILEEGSRGQKALKQLFKD